ncbi:hypothetical protein PIIN_08316 [Serendipita indica DSM 11827]|uniref:Uncharacterized protein n=1 Tax=Serendipita indica (strain DSM 11827) TaxID=1109443 RepID=G4TSS0_SERID|nr:hypothetical protein PIIN_08316 [Serendipita indica DSM 11827]
MCFKAKPCIRLSNRYRSGVAVNEDGDGMLIHPLLCPPMKSPIQSESRSAGNLGREFQVGANVKTRTIAAAAGSVWEYPAQ